MITKKKPFPYLNLLLFTAAVSLVVVILELIFPQIVYRYIWVLIGFFFLLTLGSLMMIEKLNTIYPNGFLAIYFSTMIARLFVSVGFAAVFIIMDKAHVLKFSMSFLILYLLYLGFEINGLISNLRQQK